MMACDNAVLHASHGQDWKSQESCNGNQATAAATLVEPMQVDGEGNIVIPQMDGEDDLVFSQDENAKAVAEEESASQEAEPSTEQNVQEMEQDIDQNVAAITGEINEPVTEGPTIRERTHSSESMNVESILSENDGTESQDNLPEEEKDLESLKADDEAEETAEAPVKSDPVELNEAVEEPDQFMEEKEKEVALEQAEDNQNALGSIEPAQPVQSIEPVQPVHPIQPAQPVYPIQPAQPVHPIQPAQPVYPIQPAQPVHPIQPAQPVHPIQPAQTAQPAQPVVKLKAEQTNNSINEEPPKDQEKKLVDWYDVGIIQGTNYTIQHYYLPGDDPLDFSQALTTDLFKGRIKVPLEPGTVYKFRVAAVNSCGQGPWSEVSAFKTYLPGFPGVPSAIKIFKSADGVQLSWTPPSSELGPILEYSVYLIVQSASAISENSGQVTSTMPMQPSMIRVYCGPANVCSVPNKSLSAAHVDTTIEPAILFRLSACNDKGYGPATQVRWLQSRRPVPDIQLQASPQKKVKAKTTNDFS